MARGAALITDLEQGSLPPVCAKTGEPADGYVETEFSSAPAWTLILLLFGILPFLIARFFATRRIVALVPMSAVAQRRARTFNRLCVAAIAIGLGLVVFAVLGDVPSLAVTGLIVVLAAIVFMLAGSASVLPSGVVSDEWVQLSFVHERFARELDRFYGR